MGTRAHSCLFEQPAAWNMRALHHVRVVEQQACSACECASIDKSNQSRDGFQCVDF